MVKQRWQMHVEREFGSKEVGVCGALTSSHYRAVLALTDGKSVEVDAIESALVDDLIARGAIAVQRNGSDAWLGATVSDECGVVIGVVGTVCNRLAGSDTGHIGVGCCFLHDEHFQPFRGRERDNIRRRVEKYKSDPRMLDLGSELATQRALLDTTLDDLDDTRQRLECEEDADSRFILFNVSAKLIQQAMVSADRIGQMVERVTLIEQRYALTAGQVVYIQTQVKDVLQTYITEPTELEKAGIDLAYRLGAHDKTPMLRRENA